MSDLDSSLEVTTPKYNILSRPKRNINYQNITNDINPSLLSSSESEDEDFIPMSEIDNTDHGLWDETFSSSNSDDDENEVQNGSEDKIEYAKEVPKTSKQSDKVSKNSETIPTKTENLENGYSDEKTEKTPIKKQKRRRRKKVQVFGEPLSDEETKKFISNFKNSNIKMDTLKKKRGRPKKTPEQNHKRIKSEDVTALAHDESYAPQRVSTVNNSGPFVRSEAHLSGGSACRIYSVHQSHSATHETTETKRSYVAKEKIPPIVNKKSEWTCVLCHYRPDYKSGIGSLFGPYRITSGQNLEEDITIEYKANDMLDKDSFEEIWLHEGCSVWTPGIYLKGTRITGIKGVLESSAKLKCVTCKRQGATLVCNKHGCKKVFHFPCALQAKCNFNTENFTIYCQKHALQKKTCNK